MGTLTITAKGQVTLKRDLLEHLGVKPGQKVDVDLLPDGSLKVRAAPRGKISAVFGLLDNNGVNLTIDEMNDVIARGWAGELEDSR
jgi:bifunctional DNA-binding transcriptional regulator/antitoxin component of YhaV-PrlF toxin-antitoxin module